MNFNLTKDRFIALNEICRILGVGADYLIVGNTAVKQISKDSKTIYYCDLEGIFENKNLDFIIPQLQQKVQLFSTLSKTGNEFKIEIGENGTHKISNQDIELRIIEPLKTTMRGLMLSDDEFDKRTKEGQIITNGVFDKEEIKTLDSLAQALESRRLFFKVEDGNCYFQITVADQNTPTTAKTNQKPIQCEMGNVSGFFSLDIIKSCVAPIDYTIYNIDNKRLILKLDSIILKGSQNTKDTKMTIWCVSSMNS